MPIRSFIVDVLVIHTNKTKALVFKFNVINCNTEKFCINQSGAKPSRFYCKWHENRPPDVQDWQQLSLPLTHCLSCLCCTFLKLIIFTVAHTLHDSCSIFVLLTIVMFIFLQNLCCCSARTTTSTSTLETV